MHFIQDITHMKDRFIGLSTDTKPTEKTYIGATFEETDTGLTYVYTHGGWVLWARSRQFGTMVGAELNELKIADLSSRELLGLVLNELKDIKICLSKMSDLEFKEN